VKPVFIKKHAPVLAPIIKAAPAPIIHAKPIHAPIFHEPIHAAPIIKEAPAIIKEAPVVNEAHGAPILEILGPIFNAPLPVIGGGGGHGGGW